MGRATRTSTTSEAQLRAFAEAGLTWPQVAEATGIPVLQIRIVASALGIVAAYNRPKSPAPKHNPFLLPCDQPDTPSRRRSVSKKSQDFRSLDHRA